MADKKADLAGPAIGDYRELEKIPPLITRRFSIHARG